MNFESILYFFKFSFKSKKIYVISGIINQILKAGLTTFTIAMPKYILDELFGMKQKEVLIFYMSLFLITELLVSALINYLDYIMNKSKNSVYTDFEIFMADKNMKCEYGVTEDPKFNNLKETSKYYIGGQWGEFGKIMDISFDTLKHIFTVFGIICLIISLNSIFIVLMALLIVLNSYMSAYFKQKSVAIQMKKIPPLLRGRRYYENITNDPIYAKDIRINSLTQWILNKYKQYMEKFADTTVEIYKNNLKLSVFTSFTGFLQISFSYIYLIYQVIKYNITVGSFTLLLSSINTFNSSVTAIINNFIEISRYSTYYKSFKEYINLPEAVNNTAQDTAANDKNGYSIEFKNVSFKYPGSDKYILKNLSVKLEPNKKTLLVGENGAGKTTFIKLLLGLYQPTEGQILINDIDIKDYNSDKYKEMFSAVFQDYALYALSLKENICLDKADLTKDEDALKSAQLSGLDKKLASDGINLKTQIYKYFSANGIEPSGGEGQKIAIARAYFRNSPIVILDEPTAALDPRAEYNIYKKFDELTSSKTAIFISHRLASSKICDNIILLKDGKIAEKGTHEELINIKGTYEKMFSMQAKNYVSLQ